MGARRLSQSSDTFLRDLFKREEDLEIRNKLKADKPIQMNNTNNIKPLKVDGGIIQAPPANKAAQDNDINIIKKILNEVIFVDGKKIPVKKLVADKLKIANKRVKEQFDIAKVFNVKNKKYIYYIEILGALTFVIFGLAAKNPDTAIFILKVIWKYSKTSSKFLGQYLKIFFKYIGEVPYLKNVIGVLPFKNFIDFAIGILVSLSIMAPIVSQQQTLSVANNTLGVSYIIKPVNTKIYSKKKVNLNSDEIELLNYFGEKGYYNKVTKELDLIKMGISDSFVIDDKVNVKIFYNDAHHLLIVDLTRPSYQPKNLYILPEKQREIEINKFNETINILLTELETQIKNINDIRIIRKDADDLVQYQQSHSEFLEQLDGSGIRKGTPKYNVLRQKITSTEQTIKKLTAKLSNIGGDISFLNILKMNEKDLNLKAARKVVKETSNQLKKINVGNFNYYNQDIQGVIASVKGTLVNLENHGITFPTIPKVDVSAIIPVISSKIIKKNNSLIQETLIQETLIQETLIQDALIQDTEITPTSERKETMMDGIEYTGAFHQLDKLGSIVNNKLEKSIESSFKRSKYSPDNDNSSKKGKMSPLRLPSPKISYNEFEHLYKPTKKISNKIVADKKSQQVDIDDDIDIFDLLKNTK